MCEGEAIIMHATRIPRRLHYSIRRQISSLSPEMILVPGQKLCPRPSGALLDGISAYNGERGEILENGEAEEIVFAMTIAGPLVLGFTCRWKKTSHTEKLPELLKNFPFSVN